MAVSGDSFCMSAWNAFLLHMKHCLKFGFAKFLASMFIFIGKVSLVVVNCCSLFMIMKFVTHDVEEVSSIMAPVVVVAAMSYVTASIFLSLFDESALAMITCLAIDTDVNEEPKFGPPTFYNFQDKVD